MMMKKIIFCTLLFMFIPLSRSKICQIRTSSNVTIDACCADYEKRGNYCIACSKGYTSDFGQNCKRCWKNTYGERCRYDCSCSDFEVCDNVDGCVQFSATTVAPVYATSDTFIRRINAKSCAMRTKSGDIIKVCCADYEEKGNDCIPCSIGYTSYYGQKNCTPCPNNTYGEKCRYDCSCAAFEMCDNVKGCVNFPYTTNFSVFATSNVVDDSTNKWTTNTGAHSGNDTTRSYHEEKTNEESTYCRIHGLLPREIVVYSTLAVIVIGFGICLCVVFLKYKTLTKKKVITVKQTQNSAIPQQIQTIEIADRLYEIINEEDILDDQHLQQMQMSSEYLDVIHDSNTRDSCESKNLDNQDNPCQLLSIVQTQNQERKLKVDDRSLMSGDSTSSSDEYEGDSTQDYLNPYQPMINISPPAERKYLTIPTSHSRIDGTCNYKDSEVVTNEYELQHPRETEKDAMTNLCDNYTTSSASFISNISKSSPNRVGEKEFESYENLNMERFKMTSYSGKENKKDELD